MSCSVTPPTNGLANYTAYTQVDGNQCLFGMCDVEYICDPGYILFGNPFATCNGSNGTNALLSDVGGLEVAEKSREGRKEMAEKKFGRIR